MPKTTPPSPVAAPANQPGALWVVALLCAVALAYSNTFRAPFIFDDTQAIVDNPSIRRLWPLTTALQPPSDRGTGVAGRPVLNLTLAVNYAVSGVEPWSYHVANTLIHGLAALTLFGLIRRTLAGPVLREQWSAQATPVAFGGALLWALHPLQTESVTCAIQRTESLVGLFYLLTLYSLARAAAATTTPARAGWSLAGITAGSRMRVAMRHGEDGPHPINLIGIWYGRLRDREREEKCYRSALEFGEWSTALFNLALTRRDRGDLNEAMACVDRAIAAAPSQDTYVQSIFTRPALCSAI